MKKLLITTAVGGVMFLIPLVIVVVVLGKAFDIMKKVSEPLQTMIPIETVAGIGVIEIMAVVLMFVFSIVVGVFAQIKPASRFYDKIDGFLLELIPGYAWTKTVLGNVAGTEDARHFKPVLVRLDDQVQVAFELERTANGDVVVFFPGAPDPKSGAVAYVTPDRVEPVQASFLDINRSLKHMGRGAGGFTGRE